MKLGDCLRGYEECELDMMLRPYLYLERRYVDTSELGQALFCSQYLSGCLPISPPAAVGLVGEACGGSLVPPTKRLVCREGYRSNWQLCQPVSFDITI
jgi:hypothetical protein